VFENRVLRRVFGRKKDRLTGERRKLQNEELNDLYSLHQYCVGGKMETNEMGSACGLDGEDTVCAGCWCNVQNYTFGLLDGFKIETWLPNACLSYVLQICRKNNLLASRISL
jgi:hypothetical protein